MEAAKKIDRAALKKMAKGQLKGNWGWAVCLTLLILRKSWSPCVTSSRMRYVNLDVSWACPSIW